MSFAIQTTRFEKHIPKYTRKKLITKAETTISYRNVLIENLHMETSYTYPVNSWPDKRQRVRKELF